MSHKLIPIQEISERLIASKKLNELVTEHLSKVSDKTEIAAANIIEQVVKVDEEVSLLSEQLKKAVVESDVVKQDGMSAIVQLQDSMDEMSAYMKRRENAAKEYEHKVDQILTETEKLSGLANDMNRMSIQGACLALNAAAQAAHAGEQGRGFKVVASEMREISDGLKKMASSINASIHLVAKQVVEKVDESQSSKQGKSAIESDLEMLSSFTIILESIVKSFDRYDTMNAQAFSSISKSTKQAGESIMEVMASIQFQDITRQALEGAQGTLSCINDGFDEVLKVLDNRHELIKLKPLDVESITASYVMDDQRKAHQQVFDGENQQDKPTEEDSLPHIDLF